MLISKENIEWSKPITKSTKIRLFLFDFEFALLSAEILGQTKIIGNTFSDSACTRSSL